MRDRTGAGAGDPEPMAESPERATDGAGRVTDRSGRATDDRGDGIDGRASRADAVEAISTAERVAMAVSAAFTVGLFVVAVWYAVTGPGAAAPVATVVDSHPGAGDEVIYTVELRNPGDVGLVSATVEVHCTEPPIELEFDHVPPGGRRAGTVACPAGGGVAATSVTTWMTE